MTLNKSIYVGFSILERSKSLMNQFHHDYIQYKFDAKLLFTDTGSLVYQNFYLDKDLFDSSDYPVKSKFFDPRNKKVIGNVKDEFKGKIISEFIGLKSKMYSLISVDDEEVTIVKGINKQIKNG